MSHYQDYAKRLSGAILSFDWTPVNQLAEELFDCWEKEQNVFLCGNGGSAANAIHLANDFIYGVGAGKRAGLRVEALSANPAVLTCLANDTSYGRIFSEQIKAKASKDDLLIVLSGSGNSENIVNALKVARERELRITAIVGFSGGECKLLADNVIHLPVNDMQIAEDFQLIVGHMCMQALCLRNHG